MKINSSVPYTNYKVPTPTKNQVAEKTTVKTDNTQKTLFADLIRDACKPIVETSVISDYTAAYETARTAFTPTASCPYPHCNPKVLTYDQAKAFQAVIPSTVIIMDPQNTGWWIVVEPGDSLYGLSGEELFTAIVRKYDGGRNHHSSDWGFMLNELRANGFITAEEVDALDLVRLHMEGHAKWREEQRLGTDFNLDLFIANLRFSFLDYLDVLEELSEGIPSIAEREDFIKNFEERIAAVLM